MDGTNESMEGESRRFQFVDKFRDSDYKSKFICTLYLFWAFFYLGLGYGVTGPSFLDLMLITKTDLDQASTLFTAGAAGYMVGALTCGVLYDKCNKLLLLAVVVTGTSITTAVTPLCTSLPVMVAMSALRFFFAAGIATGGNTDLIRLWGREGMSYMQALQLCFALGGLFAPLITEPFLSAKSSFDTAYNTNNSFSSFENVSDVTCNQSIIGFNNSWNETVTFTSQALSSRILFAYLIVAAVGLSAAVPFVVEFFLRKVEKNRSMEDYITRVSQTVPFPIYIVTVVMLAAYFFNNCGIEQTIMSFLTVFTVDGLNWSKADGALVTSLFWGSFAACRFLGIVFVNFLAPKKMLTLCLVLLILSLGAFLLCSIYTLTAGIWVSSVAVGLATSLVFPTSFTWIEEHVIQVTGKVTSVILIASSLAGITMPILLGFLMEKVTFMSFSYLLFVQSCVLLALYAVVNVHSNTVLRKHLRQEVKDPIHGETDELTEIQVMI